MQQVRLQSTTQDNVVTYSVVVNAENLDGALLPGMTATLDIVLNREDDVLRVSNTALRFRPTEAMLDEFASAQTAVALKGDDGSAFPLGPRGGAREGRPGPGNFPGGAMDEEAIQRRRAEFQRGGSTLGAGAFEGRPGGRGSLWYLDENGQLRFARVRTGLTDGIQTAIHMAPPEVQESLQVIASVTAGEASEGGGINPFQPQSGGGFRRFGGF